MQEVENGYQIESTHGHKFITCVLFLENTGQAKVLMFSQIVLMEKWLWKNILRIKVEMITLFALIAGCKKGLHIRHKKSLSTH
jgi:hypothetical protein